ncbi:Ig lambda chain V-I region BL2 [Tupaia chinensis]|uniref:Ig lambda chain V-I region BL2 n=1 Tax=Tupaia chinensis TaxID=246437 RepID=L9KML2_TUPCH|nr:Ig lambda chain V-I region BL2 [Tupaia chinensis]
MTWAPLLLTFLTHYTGTVAQARLTQLPSVSQNLRHTVTLTCKGDSNNVGNQGAAWLQQPPDQVPKLLTHRNNNRPPGVSERFSGSRPLNETLVEESRAALGVAGCKGVTLCPWAKQRALQKALKLGAESPGLL